MSGNERVEMKTYKVAVYNNHGGSKIHVNRPLAYLRYFTAGNCVHTVQARSGIEAKILAIREHTAPDTKCSQEDFYCHCCPGLGKEI